MTGWIKLFRKVKLNWVWRDPWDFRLWIDLLLRVNHQDAKVRLGGSIIEVTAGSLLTSMRALAVEHKTGQGRIKRILDKMQNDGMIVYKVERQFTLITICNYTIYQSLDKPDGARLKEKRGTDGAPMERAPEIFETKTGTNNNLKNLKNERILKKEREESGTEKIRNLFIKTLGRNPNIPEQDAISELLERFSYSQVQSMLREGALRGIRSIAYLISLVREDGTLDPLNIQKPAPLQEFDRQESGQNDQLINSARFEELRKRYG